MKNILLLFHLLSFHFYTFSIINFMGKDLVEIFNIARPFLPVNPCILEAGAFNGAETIVMKNSWPSSIIYSFEPVPEAYKWLVDRVRGYENIYCFSFALSNKTGFQKFFLSEAFNNPGVTFQSGSLLLPKEHLNFIPGILFKESIIVPTITIDEWAQLYKISNIDMMWLDLQGMELDVLKSSPRILSTVKVIFTEVEFVEAYAGQGKYEDIQLFMEQNGFVEYGRNFDGPGGGAYGWFGDVLFVKKGLIK